MSKPSEWAIRAAKKYAFGVPDILVTEHELSALSAVALSFDEAVAHGRQESAEEIAQLRAALERYGRHDDACSIVWRGLKDGEECTCGLEAALAPKRETT